MRSVTAQCRGESSVPGTIAGVASEFIRVIIVSSQIIRLLQVPTSEHISCTSSNLKKHRPRPHPILGNLKSGQRVHHQLGPYLGPRCVAYEQEKRKNPAERPVVNARPPATRNAKKWTARARIADAASEPLTRISVVRFSTTVPSRALEKKMMIQYLYCLVWV